MKASIITLFLLFSGLFVFAQDAVDPFADVDSKEGAEEQVAAPATLAEAHDQLEKQLPEEELKKIDAMKSEDEMVEYHFGVGMWMRNSWGVWGSSPLAKHMRDLGFTHPDDMSGVILETFWCKRHGKNFRIKERVEYYKAYWAENKWPDKNAVDPKDKSEVNWIRGYEAEGRPHRTIYIGRSKGSGRLLAFENPKGVYVPDKKLIESLSKTGASYTERITSGTTVDPLPELNSEQAGAGQPAAAPESKPEKHAQQIILTADMKLSTALEMLQKVGAQKVESAYPLFWSSEDRRSGGRHDYFNLRDGTCVQLRIDLKAPTEMIVGIGVGKPGRPYRGKLEWFEDVKAGRVSRPKELNIGSEQPAPSDGDKPPK